MKICFSELVDAYVPTRYIAGCFYSLHGKGGYYVHGTEAMNRELFEFCFIHYKSMNVAQVDINITGMKAKVLKRPNYNGDFLARPYPT